MKKWFLLALVAYLFTASPAWANTCVFVGGSHNWSDTAGWTGCGGVAPTAADTALIGTGSGGSTTGTLTIDGVSGTPSLARSVDFTSFVGTLVQASAKELDIGDASGGSLTMPSSGMTYAPNAASLIVFKSTTTGNTITTTGQSLGPVTFNGSGGAWTTAGDFTTTRDLTMTAGTLTLGSTVHIRSIIANGGTLNLGGTATFTGNITVAGGTVSGAAFALSGPTSCSLSSGTLTVLGITSTGGCGSSGATVNVGNSGVSATSMTISAGTFTTTGNMTLTTTLSITGTGSLIATGVDVTGFTSMTKSSSGTLSVRNLTGSTTQVMSGGTITVTGNVTGTTLQISGSTARTINMGSGTWTYSGTGNVLNAGATPTNIVFNPQSSTLIFTDTSATTKTFTGGGLQYNNISVSGAASAGTFTIASSNIFNGVTFAADANILLTNGTTQTISSLSATGTSGHSIIINSDSAGNAANISKSSGTVSADFLSLKDIHAIGGAAWYAGAASTNTSGNTGWIFATKPPSGQSFMSGM